LSIFDESFSTGKRSSIFLNEKAREGSASHNYCELLVSLEIMKIYSISTGCLVTQMAMELEKAQQFTQQVE
jgi:hypothetical protein